MVTILIFPKLRNIYHILLLTCIYFASGYELDGLSSDLIMKYKPNICSDENEEKFLLQANFTRKKLSSSKPTVKITIDRKNMPLIWVFFKSGSEEVPSFTISSMIDGVRTNKIEKSMDDLNLNSELNFTLSVSCDSIGFTVSFNDQWEEKLPFDTSLITSATLSISGSVEVKNAGYIGKVRSNIKEMQKSVLKLSIRISTHFRMVAA